MALSALKGAGEVHNTSQNATTNNEFSLLEAPSYRVYRRRWIGLITLMLMNIMISWGWITFAPISTSTQEFFQLQHASSVNWLSTVILLSYICMSPLVIYSLHKFGIHIALYLAAGFSISGMWLRFAGAKANSSSGGQFGLVMFGQILIGFGQPFVLSAPAYYSDIWFTSKGRITANALISLSNPLGAALGQLVGPFIVTSPSDIPNMLLYVAIMATVVAAPIFFVPQKPPRPPCPSATHEKLPIRLAVTTICRSIEFWLMFIMFSVLVGLFNASSSLLNQILEPYGYTESEAGIGGAILIVAGLLVSALVSPLIDRTHSFLLAIRILVPVISCCYIGLIFAPASGSLAPPYLLLGLLGAASFSLLPLALEFVVEVTHPVSPELTSTILWSGGQLLGAVYILSMTALSELRPHRTRGALIFQALMSCSASVAALFLGLGHRAPHVQTRRITADKTEGAEIL